MYVQLIWSLSTANGAGHLISQASTAKGSTLSWNSLYGLQSFLSAYVSGCLGQSGRLFLPLDLCASLMMKRLDEIRQNAKRGSFRAGHHRASDHLRDSALWDPHRLGIDSDIWTGILESIPVTPTRPEGHDARIASRHVLCRYRAARQPDGAVHCAELGPSRHGHDDHLSPIYQHSSWRVHCHGCRHRALPVELRQSGHDLHHVRAPVQGVTDSTSSTSCLPCRSIISGWGVFLAPMAGIVIADYFVVHRRELHLDDLYIGNDTSAYWYTAGFNWRAPVAWYASLPPPCLSPFTLPLSAVLVQFALTFPRVHRAMGVWPLLPGFARQVRGISDYSGWDNIFRINFFVGLGIAFIVHAVLH